MEILKIDEIVLRKIEDKDAKEMYEYAKNPIIGEMSGWDAHKSILETKSVIKTLKMLKTYSILYNNVMVGTIGYEIINKKLILGYSLSQDYWKKNIMHRSLKVFINYAFKYLNIDYIEADTYLDNIRSQNVLLKLGFKNNGVFTKEIKNKDVKFYLFILKNIKGSGLNENSEKI